MREVGCFRSSEGLRRRGVGSRKARSLGVSEASELPRGVRRVSDSVCSEHGAGAGRLTEWGYGWPSAVLGLQDWAE